MRNEHPVTRPVVAALAATAFALGTAHAQEAAESEDDADAVELAPVLVTGSRLNRPATELSGNLIVLDEDAIRATGEVTVAGVLRQLPQNINGTSEVFGSRLNGARNFSGAATVNLRGIGSDSTLILVDGRRIGYSGILGGVTDVSTIPLNMVERIEILLDGSSAVYGSDAVGGVVNIITKKDYQGVDVSINYARPHKSGYDETTLGVSAGFAWTGGRGVLGYEFFNDSGLDSSGRESILNYQRDGINNQKNAQPGPQMRIYTYFFDDSCNAARAVVYRVNGRVITRAEHAELDEAEQAAAECHSDVTLPLGFMPGDDLNGIEIFGAPNWGEATERGYSLRPEQVRHSLNLGVDHALTDALKLHGNVRYTTKDTNSNSGLNSVSGWLHANSPFNPFGHRVFVQGHTLNARPVYYDSTVDQLFLRAGLEGTIGTWTWEAEFNRSQSEVEARRMNALDFDTVRLGLDSDGVTEAVIARISGGTAETCEAERVARGGTRARFSSFFGGSCTIYGAPPDPINPFGDLSSYVADVLRTGSTNTQTQFEALARSELFDLPGGKLALVVGYDYRNDELDSMSEFHQAGSLCSAVSCANATPAGNKAFNTQVGRDNHGFFLEGVAPLVGRDNATQGVQRLSLTFSARRDSYSNVEVAYRESASGEAGTANPADPGSASTYGLGLVWRASDGVQIKANLQTSFKAPQLSQLIARTQERVPAARLRGLYFSEPDSQGRTQTHDNVLDNIGGNDQLQPEKAKTVSLGLEFAPEVLRGVRVKATWSDTDIEDRINYFSSITGIDPNNLPSNVVYIAEEDIYLRDNRWINVAKVDRSGMDYEIGYQGGFGESEVTVTVRHSRTSRFDARADQADPEVQSILTTRNDKDYGRRVTLPPVPKHSTNAQVTWTRAGLSVSADVQNSARTTRIATGSTDGFEFFTDPPTLVDLVLGYDFGTGGLLDTPWATDLTATLTINNLTNKFANNYQVDLGSGERRDFQFNPTYEWTQGRAYRLALRKSF